MIAVQWNICDQHSRQTFNYLLKGTRQNSGMWNVRTWPVSPIFLENTLHEVCLIPIPDFRKSALPFLMRAIFSLERYCLLPVPNFDSGIFESHHQTKSNLSWIGEELLRTSLIWRTMIYSHIWEMQALGNLDTNKTLHVDPPN